MPAATPPLAGTSAWNVHRDVGKQPSDLCSEHRQKELGEGPARHEAIHSAGLEVEERVQRAEARQDSHALGRCGVSIQKLAEPNGSRWRRQRLELNGSDLGHLAADRGDGVDIHVDLRARRMVLEHHVDLDSVADAAEVLDQLPCAGYSGRCA